MRLTNLERETIILFNEAEGAASVYTFNGRIKKRLEELHIQHKTDVSLQRADGDSVTYKLPKSWIRINAPRKVKPLSEEQKAKLLKRLG